MWNDNPLTAGNADGLEVIGADPAYEAGEKDSCKAARRVGRSTINAASTDVIGICQWSHRDLRPLHVIEWTAQELGRAICFLVYNTG